MADPGMRRIRFELEQDEDGWPPVLSETLWARDLGGGEYELDNIPFFARGVSVGDVVRAVETDDLPTFTRVLVRGGHGTIRVLVADASEITAVRQALTDLGADSESAGHWNLVAVDVPPAASLAAIRSFVAESAAAGTLDWEEADVPS